MAAEKTFENEIKKFLNSIPNTWFYKNWSGPYSKAGIPDIIACVNGQFVAIEVKASNGRASELQKRNIRLIRESGGLGYILYPRQFESFKKDIYKLLNINSSCIGCNKLKNLKCTRIGINGQIGVCWMEKSEGEY
ncbi:VRR-NUC domain-containing protein [uncultured Clostridium sp.]|uniref:VRR-NUC domain-containing protein n=1 Tax=uncultured Clostridium sp. TaxID=59620 RepID=UPI00258FAD5C|nr:VRR-NUC domain-containing protein [uncultured Clostridium sp.]MDU1348298.1 VRR-NUC domain-containing protein [Clostridium argentinense]